MQAGYFLATHRLKLLAPSLLAVFLALLAIPSSLVSTAAAGGQYTPLVSLLLLSIKQQVLPPGWLLFNPGFNDFNQLYIATAVIVTLLLGSPLIAFALFDRIVSWDIGRRRLVVFSLTALSSVAILSGALFGFYFLALYAVTATSPLCPPVIAGCMPMAYIPDFYLVSIGTIALSALAFALPEYAAAAIFFRRRERSTIRN